MKKPFWLHRQKCGMVFFYDNHDIEIIPFSEQQPYIDFAESAKDLIDNLEDHWCVAFLEALKVECDRRIAEDERLSEEYIKELNEKYAPLILKEKEEKEKRDGTMPE